MTLRPKTTVKRSHRPPADADHRRTLFMNVGFGLVVVLGVLILGGAGFASWYGDHLANLVVVNGQGISKDDFRDRARVDAYRLDYQEAQIRALMASGKLDDAAGNAQISSITNARNSIETDTIERLIDATLQGQLAAQQGVSVTDQQVDDEMTTEATTPEARHLWVIGVKPKVSDGATAPTDQQKADAKAIADKALADLKAGTDWNTVAKTMTDDVYSSRSGDAGWVAKDSTVMDASVQAPLFTLPVNGLTDVVLGADGIYRIGRVTEIAPTSVDQAFQQKIKDSGISIDSYKRVAKADALQKALNTKLVADSVDQATPQRHVAQIFLAVDSSGTAGVGDEVQVRHILFSPNHDPNAAQGLDAGNPAWKAAEDLANTAYAELQKDPSKFQDIAKAQSDDTGTKADGGLLPYYTKTQLDPAFANAIFADGLQKDQILAPVKSSFGWHVIQFLDRRKQASDRMKDIQAQASAAGADFAALAKQYSEDTTSKDNGGDIGWVAKNQLDSVREIAIFKAQVGGLTDVITTSTGIYLYKILEEQTRKPDQAQIDTLKANAFNNWYTAQRNFAHIERLYDTSSSSNIPPVQ
jgi:parvulin-like peptidyl-prolyl isomerase